MVQILIPATLTVGSPTIECGKYFTVVLITFDTIEAGTSFIGVAVPPLCTKSSKSFVAPLTPFAFFIPVLARPVSILLEAPSSVDDVYLPLTKLRILAPPEHLFRRKIHFDGPCCRGLGIVARPYCRGRGFVWLGSGWLGSVATVVVAAVIIVPFAAISRRALNLLARPAIVLASVVTSIVKAFPISIVPFAAVLSRPCAISFSVCIAAPWLVSVATSIVKAFPISIVPFAAVLSRPCAISFSVCIAAPWLVSVATIVVATHTI